MAVKTREKKSAFQNPGTRSHPSHVHYLEESNQPIIRSFERASQAGGMRDLDRRRTHATLLNQEKRGRHYNVIVKISRFAADLNAFCDTESVGTLNPRTKGSGQ